MRELNSLLYNAIKTHGYFRDLTGATVNDPRIYKARTPVKNPIDANKPAYAVYYQSGTSRPYPIIYPIQKNDYTFVIEVYGKEDTLVSEICYRLEKLFAHKNFTTPSFLVNYTYATRGSCTFDDARQLYFETITIRFSNILALDEAS